MLSQGVRFPGSKTDLTKSWDLNFKSTWKSFSQNFPHAEIMKTKRTATMAKKSWGQKSRITTLWNPAAQVLMDTQDEVTICSFPPRPVWHLYENHTILFVSLQFACCAVSVWTFCLLREEHKSISHDEHSGRSLVSCLSSVSYFHTWLSMKQF